MLRRARNGRAAKETGPRRLDVRLETLRAVSRALARPQDLVDILRSIHQEITRVLDATICFFGLYHESSQSVEVVWQVHDQAELGGGSFPLGTGLISQIIRTRQPRLIRHWSQQGPRVQVQYATDRPGLPESAICVPVLFDDRVLGVLSIQSYQPEAFVDSDLALIEDIANQAAVAIAAARGWSPDITEERRRVSELEAILASMSDALLVVDEQGRLVRLNEPARRLLCGAEGAVILGHPVDRPQDGCWPLGTQPVSEKLRPIIELLRQGKSPLEDVEIVLPGKGACRINGRGSVLRRDGAYAGGLVVLREIGPPPAA